MKKIVAFVAAILSAAQNKGEEIATKKLTDYLKKNKANVKRDQKNRWVNVVFEVEEGVITTYSPDVLIKSNTKSSIAVGSIAIYQLL